MELEEEYYRADFDNTEIYKLRSDGYLFKFDFAESYWEMVSDSEEFDISWEPLDKEELNSIILDVYKNFSFYTINKYLTDDNKEPYDFGDDLQYFIKDNQIGAIDNKGNHFICHPGLLEPVDSGTITEEWETLTYDKVIDALNMENREDSLQDMELYFDEDNDIIAISDDGEQYYLSKRTGDLLKIFEKIEVSPSWKRTSFSIVQDLFNDFTSVYTYHLQENNFKLCNYLNDSARNLGIKLSYDMLYFDDGYHNYYAVDNKNNEYKCESESLVSVPMGTVKQREWDRVDPLYLMEYLDFHIDRKEMIERGDNTSIYDIKLFITEDKKLIGQNDKKENFFVNKEGELTKLENESYVPKNDIPLIEAVKYKSVIKNKYLLNDYIDRCESQLKVNGISIDDEIEFFCDFEEKDFDVYLKDGKGQEFRLEPTDIYPVDKGTIKNDFTEVSDMQALTLIQASYDHKYSVGKIDTEEEE